jgi:hypothetical protein
MATAAPPQTRYWVGGRLIFTPPRAILLPASDRNGGAGRFGGAAERGKDGGPEAAGRGAAGADKSAKKSVAEDSEAATGAASTGASAAAANAVAGASNASLQCGQTTRLPANSSLTESFPLQCGQKMD